VKARILRDGAGLAVARGRQFWAGVDRNKQIGEAVVTQVFFATNRAADPTKPNGFGSGIVAEDPNAILYAVCDVPSPETGQIGAISDRTMGRFSDAATEAIVGGGKNLFVFIHGFDNSFEDALSRAAFNADWYRASTQPDADTVVIAFTWPSKGELIGSPLKPLDSAYWDDQGMAGASGFHLGHFFSEIDRLRAIYAVRNPTGRLFLLAHSMGNWALQAAMGWWYQQQQQPDDMFDEVVLAAADEVADSFEAPNGARLSRIADLAKRVTIYSSRKDAILQVSAVLNNHARLGEDGPKDKTDPNRYPRNVFRMMDCTGVSDFSRPFLSEETHQYYRLSPTVRNDITAVMVGNALPIGGLGALEAPPLGF
jgi:esterase/lipase superfamily enzyme